MLRDSILFDCCENLDDVKLDIGANGVGCGLATSMEEGF